jgi:putative flippase GtrA
LQQVPRFALIGGFNTLLDLLVLNGLLWLFPTSNTLQILLYTVLAFSAGAVNSFLLNKYWTFQHRQPTTWAEVARFATTTLFSLVWNCAFIWLASAVPHPFITNTVIWTNVSRVAAIASGSLLSFLGMRLWVFVRRPHAEKSLLITCNDAREPPMDKQQELRTDMHISPEEQNYGYTATTSVSKHSLSVVLPAYNEEQVIASTLRDVLLTLNSWHIESEIIVVNDGSKDRTGFVVNEIASIAPQVRLINHPVNQGYGAALVSGFAAATKELTLFMDSDGQFQIEDLRPFLTFIDSYDAAIGYRIDRQDSWMRKLNAWGWNRLIRAMLGVSVRDIDCAFKLLRTEYLQRYPLETRGAMVNAELLYKLQRSGHSWKEVGVHHLPRRTGKATGAKISVILRAFRELRLYASKWRREEQPYGYMQESRQVAHESEMAK